ncbi:fatty acid desaturase 6 [Oreochromis aureus]|uniref:Fatty acid desaturase domain-containing protein n=1 Tax=Oreochromis aureus TaxID=47969 RepID=A0A668SJ90_OREAU|nr:fatty acid desaturase 6 [Oreochromis aureus]XP_039471998.1 fatty acid desaturase 6 [Oreochromis aureus]
MQSVPDERRDERERGRGGDEEMLIKKRGDPKIKNGGAGAEEVEKESLMMELTRLVQKVVKESSWWERRGVDCSILAAAFLCLPPAFLLLGSSRLLGFSAGVLLMGVAHAVITVKGTHLASHGALSESQAWGRIWAVFFIEICGSFSARAGIRGHIKMHHAHTNVIGLGDSSVWKVPFLPRIIYLFIAPLAVPIITPLVALAQLKGHSLAHILRTVLMVTLGLYSQYWLLINVSGFTSPYGALLCMLVCRAMFSVPYIHVNIFQHIGLPMFSPTRRPKRIHQMTHGVLNLPRNPLLDWIFGHSLINCHVEHHLFPFLSDNMCLKVKPVVSKYLTEKQLPYQEDTYLSRLHLFFHKYQELMVFAPPITELVGVQ